jgi:hypothetical protein
MPGPLQRSSTTQPLTLNALKRWCANDATLPPVHKIKELHVYDFDNTLFLSPLPNRALWDSKWYGRLQNKDVFVNGGWWHALDILAATGSGVEIEEERGWEGHWNRTIVQLARMSIAEPDTLTVLLTGRAEAPFAPLLQRMCKSRNLQFDIHCLKPDVGPDNQRFNTTMVFKQEFLKSLLNTYSEATDIRIYEDRLNHVVQFREFLEYFNSSNQARADLGARAPINAKVVEVTELPSILDPVVEAAAIQKMINEHNLLCIGGAAPENMVPLELTKKVLYTAYQITSKTDSDRLISLVAPIPKSVRRLANSIVITPFPASDDILARAGGLGKTIPFQVLETGQHDNRIWAAKVGPAGNHKTFTHSGRLLVVIAISNDAKPADVRLIRHWRRVEKDKTFQFDAVVREIFRLTIEEEQSGEPRTPTQPSSFALPQRRRPSAPDSAPPPTTIIPTAPADRNGPAAGHNQQQQQRGGGHRGRGSFRRGDSRGGRGGGYAPRGSYGARGRGRGYFSSYRSLDDVPSRSTYTDYDSNGGHRDGGSRGSGMYNNY